MQDREKLESYVKNHRWDAADEWLCNELCYVHTRVIRRRICTHIFAILLTVIYSGFTWGLLFPSAENIDIAKFSFAKAAFSSLDQLFEMFPGYEVVTIIGLLLLPFLVFLLLLLFTCVIKSKKYAKKGRVDNSRTVEEKIGLLDKMYSKYNHGYFEILLSYLCISVIIGVIMAAAATPNADYLFRYIFVGAMCAAVYGVCFWTVCYIVHRIYGAKEAPIFNPYHYYDYIRISRGESIYTGDDDTPTTTTFDDGDITTILDDVLDDLSGGGWGDY